MPGLRSYLLRDAKVLPFYAIQEPAISSPFPSAVTELDRMHMPLQKIDITVGRAVNDAISALALPEDPSRRNYATINRFAVHYKDQNRLTSQIRSDLHGSAESEHDLAAMVHDFIENGSNGSDFPNSSENGQNGIISNGSKPLETLQSLRSRFDAPPTAEKELLNKLLLLALSLKEADLICHKQDADCNGGCIGRLFVKHLRYSGYDAAICRSRWSNSGKVPGGEYQYIDVFVGTDEEGLDRLIVDIDFLSQFEIARPTQAYETALKLLPVIFVGSAGRLEETLGAMAEAAKMSLRQNSMHLPPWRTLDYMTAKWMSPCERNSKIECDYGGDVMSRRHPGTTSCTNKQCAQQLRHLKLCINSGEEK